MVEKPETTNTVASGARAAPRRRLARRPEWVAYAACAWGMFFAAQHLAFAGAFELGPAVHHPWSVATAWTFSVVLFGLLALFPLALVWPSSQVRRRSLQIGLLAASYAAMILLNLSSFFFSWSGFGLYPLAVCAAGGLVAFLRPRNRGVPHWMVLVATGVFGVGMTLYGVAYLYLAFLQPTLEGSLGYLLIGGMNWTVEGVLFVAATWLVNGRRSNPRQQRKVSST